MKSLNRLLVFLALVTGGSSSLAVEAPAPPQAQRDLILSAMKQELDRSFTGLRVPGFEAPYYIGFRLDDETSFAARAEFGVLQSSGGGSSRQIAVDLRVGNYAMDNTRPSVEKGLTSLASL